MSEIKLEVAYPVHPIIKKYVDYYYILNAKKSCLNNVYTAFPNSTQPVIFFEDTDIVIHTNQHYLNFSKNAKCFYGILNRFIHPLQVTLTGNIRTINIIFKGLGFNAFIKCPYAHIVKSIFQKINCWNVNEEFISKLFSLQSQQLVQVLDDMLLNNYNPFINEPLFNAINLMNANDRNYEIKEIEHLLKISRKTLFRLFTTNTGTSPTSYRRITRFRQALEKNNAQNLSLTQLAYDVNFADQSHFIKELRKLTGDKPSSFVKNTEYVKGSKFLIKRRV